MTLTLCRINLLGKKEKFCIKEKNYIDMFLYKELNTSKSLLKTTFIHTQHETQHETKKKFSFQRIYSPSLAKFKIRVYKV